MAYKDEKTEVLAQIRKNSRGEHVTVSKITNTVTNTVSGDVRLYYTADDDSLKPTPKGCRFNAEMAPEIVTAMLGLLEVNELEDLRDAIDSMLDGEDEPSEEDGEDEDATEDDGFME